RDPQNDTCLLDIGDTYVSIRDWQNALDAYEEALQRQPGHDWAYPSAVYCRYRLTGVAEFLDELRFMANAPPDECGTADMLKQMTGGYNFEDRRRRATDLMLEIEPDFVPAPRPHDENEDEDENDEAGDE
ncbi:MAG: hypothetical protein K2V38_27315, partial [Gemmataceae bacterium]|nr:hypothetical protein [Gemmataceae bacterium]